MNIRSFERWNTNVRLFESYSTHWTVSIFELYADPGNSLDAHIQARQKRWNCDDTRKRYNVTISTDVQTHNWRGRVFPFQPIKSEARGGKVAWNNSFLRARGWNFLRVYFQMQASLVMKCNVKRHFTRNRKKPELADVDHPILNEPFYLQIVKKRSNEFTL